VHGGSLVVRTAVHLGSSPRSLPRRLGPTSPEFAPESLDGELRRPLDFHAAGISHASLTPGIASQSRHVSTQGIQAPGGALRRSDHERRPISAAGRSRRASTLQVRPPCALREPRLGLFYLLALVLGDP